MAIHGFRNFPLGWEITVHDIIKPTQEMLFPWVPYLDTSIQTYPKCPVSQLSPYLPSKTSQKIKQCKRWSSLKAVQYIGWGFNNHLHKEQKISATIDCRDVWRQSAVAHRDFSPRYKICTDVKIQNNRLAFVSLWSIHDTAAAPLE